MHFFFFLNKTRQLLVLLILGATANFSTASQPTSVGTPETILRKEHKAILLVTESLLQDLKALQAGEEADPERLNKAVDFYINFADRCHHAKEENIYFASLEAKDPAERNLLVSEFTAQHARFKVLLSQMQAVLERGGARSGPIDRFLERLSCQRDRTYSKGRRTPFCKTRDELVSRRTQSTTQGLS